MAHDRKDRFRYAALQSDAGAELRRKFKIDHKDLSSFILIDGNHCYKKTTGALMVLKHLGFPWSLIYIFIILPPFIRNISYNIIARYRYKWFGKRETCRVPTEAERMKFL